MIDMYYIYDNARYAIINGNTALVNSDLVSELTDTEYTIIELRDMVKLAYHFRRLELLAEQFQLDFPENKKPYVAATRQAWIYWKRWKVLCSIIQRLGYTMPNLEEEGIY